MGVKVINRIYNELYRAEPTNWLLGNVGDWQKLRLQLEVGVDFFGSTQNQIGIDYIQNSFTLMNGKRWSDYGFDIGQIITLKFLYEVDTDGDGDMDDITSVTQDYTIINIYGSTIEVQESIDVYGFETIPVNYGTKKISNVMFYVDEETEGVRLSYQHISNDDYQTQNLTSIIDGTTTQLVSSALKQNGQGIWHNLTPVGMQSGMSIRQGRVRKIDNPLPQNDVLTIFVTPSDYQYTLSIQSPTLTFNAFATKAIPINKVYGNPVGYHSVSNISLVSQNLQNGNFNNGNEQQLFMRYADDDFLQDINVDVNFRITNTNNTSSTSYLRLMLVRYNGANRQFQSVIELKKWLNVSGLQGQLLSHSQNVSLSVSNGDSYGLYFEWFHQTPPNSSRFVDLKIESCILNIGKKNQSLSLSPYKRYYELEIDYLISSFFENIDDLESKTIPEYLGGDGSLTDNFDVRFYPKWNNPNTHIKNEMSNTERLGNTGWFDENFNELENNFKVDSIAYFDEYGNPTDALDYFAPTKVQAIISGVPNVSADTECGFGFMWIPRYEENYKIKETPFYRNTFVSTGKQDDGYKVGTFYPTLEYGAGLNGASMDTKNVRFTNLGGNKIAFEAIFVPNPDFALKFDEISEDDRNYIIWVSVADSTLIRNFSDRVSLLADMGKMIKTVPPAGAYDYLQNAFIEHPYSADAVGVEEYVGFVQDDILCRIPFQIDITRDNFRKMRFGVEAYNPSTGRRYLLETYDVDLSQYPYDTNGIPQYDLDTTRGFKLEQGNNKNWVKIQRNQDFDNSGRYGYVAYYAFKIRWEDWLAVIGVPNDFFDANELNNGFNRDWVHYLRTIGWRINFTVEIDSEVNGELLRYKNDFRFRFNDYDENNLISTKHTYIRDSDNTVLNIGVDPEYGVPLGVVLSNELTRLEIEYEIMDGGTWDINSVYATVTIEVDRGAGFMQMRQLSSVWGSENDNPLKPLQGATRLHLSIDQTGKFLTTSCLIDPSFLDEAPKYRITGRVGCYDRDEPIIQYGKYEARYEDRYE